ncbi:MAG: hypothetical protein ACPG6V_08295 [Flavobacteriales bacterium]
MNPIKNKLYHTWKLSLFKKLNMSRMLCVVIFMLTRSTFGMGWNDKMEITPNGIRFTNYLKGNEFHLEGSTVYQCNKWYFYNKHIIGERSIEPKYFAISEDTKAAIFFNNFEEWKLHLNRLDLEPLLWIRWYNGDWTFFNDDFQILLFFYGIPIALFLLFFIPFYLKFRKNRTNLKKLDRIIFLGLLLVPMLIFVLEQFPQSI